MILLAILIEVWLRASLVAIYSWGALEATGEVGAPAWVFMLNALVSVLGGPRARRGG